MSLWNWGRIPLNIFYFFCPISACCSCQWIHAKGLHKRYRNLQTPPPPKAPETISTNRGLSFTATMPPVVKYSPWRERDRCAGAYCISHTFIGGCSSERHSKQNTPRAQLIATHQGFYLWTVSVIGVWRQHKLSLVKDRWTTVAQAAECSARIPGNANTERRLQYQARPSAELEPLINAGRRDWLWESTLFYFLLFTIVTHIYLIQWICLFVTGILNSEDLTQ